MGDEKTGQVVIEVVGELNPIDWYAASQLRSSRGQRLPKYRKFKFTMSTRKRSTKYWARAR